MWMLPSGAFSGLSQVHPEVHGKQKDDKAPFYVTALGHLQLLTPQEVVEVINAFEKGTLCPLLYNWRGTIGTQWNPAQCLNRTGWGLERNVKVMFKKKKKEKCATSPTGLRPSLWVELKTEEFRAMGMEREAIQNVVKCQHSPNFDDRCGRSVWVWDLKPLKIHRVNFL